MILSAQLKMSDQQAITATAVSTNIIDLGQPGTPYDAAAPLHRDIGKGTEIPLLVQVTETFDNLTSLAIAVEVSDDEAFSSFDTLTTETVLLADLVEGKQMCVQVVPNCADKRYLRTSYTVVGTAPTVGKVTAAITMGNQTNVTGA